MEKQKTIRQSFSVEGKGLHTGKNVTVSFQPLPPDSGIIFSRTDIEGNPKIKAIADFVSDTSRGTTLKNDKVIIRTIEHLLAAVSGMKIDNLLIEVDCEEIPIIDGSSELYIQKFIESGIEEQNSVKNIFKIEKNIVISDAEKNVIISVTPCDVLKITCIIDYNSSIIPPQEITLDSISDFRENFAPARTFAFLHEIEPLLKNGLIKGGDLQNAIVFIDHIISEEEQRRLAEYFNMPDIKVLKEGVLNNVQLRFENEPARHKLLDLLGDITLVGYPFTGHIKAVRPGHKTNTDFAKLLRKYISQQLLQNS